MIKSMKEKSRMREISIHKIFTIFLCLFLYIFFKILKNKYNNVVKIERI